MRLLLVNPTRSLDLLSSRLAFGAALSEPLSAQEMANPTIAAQMLGQAIVLGQSNPTEPLVSVAIHALLDAGARADIPVRLPRHWRMDPEIGGGSCGDDLPTGPGRHPSDRVCMPLEWFLACHHPMESDRVQSTDELPEKLTRALFAAVDFHQPRVQGALARFLRRCQPASTPSPAAHWLQVQVDQARLDTRLPQATEKPPAPRL